MSNSLFHLLPHTCSLALSFLRCIFLNPSSFLTAFTALGTIDDLTMARFDALDALWDVDSQKATSLTLLSVSWVADGRGNNDSWMHDFNAFMSRCNGSNNSSPLVFFLCLFHAM